MSASPSLLSLAALPKAGSRIDLPFLAGSSDALALAEMATGNPGKLLAVVTANAADAQRLLDEIPWFGPKLRVRLLPDWETLPYDTFSPHQDLVSERLATLWRLHAAGGQRDKEADVDVVLGCDATLRTHLATYLTARAPRTQDDLRDAFKDAIGSQLASAAAICFVRNPAAQTFWGRYALGFARRWGVRTAIWHALASEKIEFDTNRGNDGVGLPKPVVLYANGTSGSSSGTIATMKEEGDAFAITFKKETWKEPVCKVWKETNRVEAINFDTGKLIYRSTCVKTATETASSTAEPVTVTKELAAGLKVGVAASFARNDDGSGYPIAIYGDKKRTKLVGAFGVTY